MTPERRQQVIDGTLRLYKTRVWLRMPAAAKAALAKGAAFVARADAVCEGWFPSREVAEAAAKKSVLASLGSEALQFDRASTRELKGRTREAQKRLAKRAAKAAAGRP